MKRTAWYYIISFGLGWLLMGLGMALAPVNLILYQCTVALAMFAPMLGVLAACGSLREAKSGIRWRPRLRGHVRHWLLALWGPAVLTALGAAVYFLLFPDQLDWSLSYVTALTGGAPAGPIIAIQLLSAVTLAPVFNLVFALGEEAGWRGWMTPRLQRRFGPRAGMILSGVIWGVWHWPLILLVGYNYGTGYPGAPWTGALAMCVFTTAAGTLLSWLYARGGSILLPALAHGAVNAVASAPILFTDGTASSQLLGPAPVGLVAVLPALAVAVVVLVRPHREGTME